MSNYHRSTTDRVTLGNAGRPRQSLVGMAGAGGLDSDLGWLIPAWKHASTDDESRVKGTSLP